MSLSHRPVMLFSLIAALWMATGCTGSTGQVGPADKPAETMDTLVTADWLRRHLDDPDLVVLDCTVLIEQAEDGSLIERSGRASYEAAHIPTAGFADLTGDLSDKTSSLKYALPSAQKFADAMGALGVGDDSRVVLYSANNQVWAARVWWMLRWIGFDRAALLDGGLDAWTATGLPLSADPVDPPARTLTPRVRPELMADRDEVFAAITDTSVTLIDAMPGPHYRGEMSMYDRPGHIAGAINVPVYSLVDDTGHFRSPDELTTVFDQDPDSRVITYCGGGIAASATAFVMTRLGFTNVALYPASLQEWAADPGNPMEVAPVEDEFGP